MYSSKPNDTIFYPHIHLLIQPDLNPRPILQVSEDEVDGLHHHFLHLLASGRGTPWWKSQRPHKQEGLLRQRLPEDRPGNRSACGLRRPRPLLGNASLATRRLFSVTCCQFTRIKQKDGCHRISPPC